MKTIHILQNDSRRVFCLKENKWDEKELRLQKLVCFLLEIQKKKKKKKIHSINLQIIANKKFTSFNQSY